MWTKKFCFLFSFPIFSEPPKRTAVQVVVANFLLPYFYCLNTFSLFHAVFGFLKNGIRGT